MSNYHYNDQNGCVGCLKKSAYSQLKNVNDYTCDLPCLCRFNVDERSDKDKMYYDWFVLQKPMKLPMNGVIPNPSFKMCNNNN
jgi:hypothetical protein